MKANYILIFLVSLTWASFTGCVDAPRDPIAPPVIDERVVDDTVVEVNRWQQIQDHYGVPNILPIDCLLWYAIDRSVDYQTGAILTTTEAKAIFTKDSQFVDVDRVKLNSVLLGHTETGFYELMDPAIPADGRLIWFIGRIYGNTNFAPFGTVPRPIIMTGIQSGDTISISSGLHSPYTGYDNTTFYDTELQVTIEPDSIRNSVLLGIHTTDTTDRVRQIISDTGRVDIQPLVLRDLTPNRHYRMILHNLIYSEDRISGRTIGVGVLSSYSTSTYIYLVP